MIKITNYLLITFNWYLNFTSPLQIEHVTIDINS